MLRLLLIAGLLLSGLSGIAQLIGVRVNTGDSTQETYVTNSPGNTPGNSKVVQKIRDTSYHRLLSKRVTIDRLASSFNDGIPSCVIFSNATGDLKRATIISLATAISPLVPVDSNLFATHTWVIARGYISTELDPIWTAASVNYYTKTQADTRYLQAEVDGSITNELQQLSLGGDDSLAITLGNKVKLPYLRSFSETDPVWTLASTNYYTKSQADVRFLQTELDPVWLAQKTGYYTKTELQTSGAAAVHWLNITNKPTFATVATSGSYPDLINKPTIPAAQIQSDWTQGSSGSLDFIKNKPDHTFVQPSRSLNVAFQPNTIHDMDCRYTCTITCVLSLLGGQTGTIFLESSPDNVTWTQRTFLQNANSGIIGLTNANGGQIGCIVKAGFWLRLRSSGTATMAFNQADEVPIK